MKIVIDTNIIISALFSKKGASNRLLTWLFKKQTKYNVVSNTLLTEYNDVLTRDENIKQNIYFSKKELEMFLDDLCLISHHQKINFLWRPFLKDIKDDMVLEVAFNANADFIVSNNKKDFKEVEQNFDIKVVNAKEFLEIIERKKL